MKTLQELQAGDWVMVYKHDQPQCLGQITRASQKTLYVHSSTFDRVTGKTNQSHKWGYRISPAPPEKLEEKRRKEEEAARKRAAREALEATEGYQLALAIEDYSFREAKRLCTMPIEQLRQIVAWLNEHEASTNTTKKGE